MPTVSVRAKTFILDTCEAVYRANSSLSPPTGGITRGRLDCSIEFVEGALERGSAEVNSSLGDDCTRDVQTNCRVAFRTMSPSGDKTSPITLNEQSEWDK